MNVSIFSFENENKVNSHNLIRIFSDSSIYQSKAFVECTKYQEESYGWIPFFSDRIVTEIDGFLVLKLRVQKKILNSNVIKDMLETRRNNYIKEIGVKPDNKTIREYKEEIKQELISSEKAQVGSEYIEVVIDTSRKYLLINTTTDSNIKYVLDCLKDTLPATQEFPVVPVLNVINGEIATVLREWLNNPNSLPIHLELFDSVSLVDLEGQKAIYTKHDLLSSIVAEDIKQGKTVTSLGMTWQDKISFVITDKCQIKSIKLADKEDNETQISLYSNDIAEMLECIFDELGGFREIQQESLID